MDAPWASDRIYLAHFDTLHDRYLHMRISLLHLNNLAINISGTPRLLVEEIEL